MVDALVRITVIFTIAAALTALGEVLRRQFGRTRYEGPALDVYETAYLVDGTARVALVATVDLIRSGHLRLKIDRLNRLELVPDHDPPADGPERQVCQMVWSRRLTTVGDVGHGLDASAIRVALVRRGLLMTTAQRWLLRMVSWGGAAVLVMVALAVDPGQDVAVLMLALLGPVAWFYQVERSSAGSAEMRRLVKEPQGLMRLAVDGTRALADRHLRRAIERSLKQTGFATDWEPIFGP